MKYLTWTIFIILGLATFVSLIRPGYFPMHDDIQAMRVLQMSKCFQDWQIPCRWVPDMGYGYGYPQFHYYPPLPFYLMTSIHLLGVSLLDSVKVGFILSFVVSGLGMYLLGKNLWGKQGGLLSSLFYLYLPYRATNVYARGAMGEIWAMAWFPWILWSIQEYFRTKNRRYLLYLSLALAALATSHLLSALMITPLLVTWVLYKVLFSAERKNLNLHLISLFVSGLLAIGLSAYYVLPVLFEKNAAHLETLTMGYFNYLAHYVNLKQLFLSSYWNYGSSLFGPHDEMSLSIGLLHWTIPLVSLVIAWKYRKAFPQHYNYLVVLIFFGLAYLFLSHSKSTPLWLATPSLEILQFPWRFLAPAGFVFSLAAGSIATWSLTPDPNSIKYSQFMIHDSRFMIRLLLVVIPLILLNLSQFRPQLWLDITDTDKLSGQSWDKQQTISIFDYLPRAATHPPTAPAPEQPWFVTGVGQITSYDKGSHWQSGSIQVRQPGQLRLPMFDFPGMRATIDGQPTPIDNDNELGLITINVPSGNHLIAARLTNTPVRTFGNALTAISLLTLLAAFINKPHPNIANS